MTAAEPLAEFGAPAQRHVTSVPAPELGSTSLDALRSLVAEEVESEPIEINVPKRPGMSVRFSIDLDGPKFQSWQRGSKDRSSATGYDDLKLSCVVLSNQCVGLVINDEVVLDDDGQPATFRSPSVMEMFGARDAAGCVRKVYANDGHLSAVANEVVRACGWGEEVAANAADPT